MTQVLAANKCAIALAAFVLVFSASCSSGDSGDTSPGPASEPASATDDKAGAATDPPPASGLDFVEVGPLPERFRGDAASPGWTVGITNNAKAVEVRSPDGMEVLHTHTAPIGYSIADVFLDEPHLVIVTKKQDDSTNDDVIVLDINTFEERRLDKSAPEPARGSWAVGAGKLAYGSHRDDEYCLAEVDLVTMSGELRECVPPRHGITQVGISPYGLGYQTFDDQQPASCGTARIQRTDGVPETIEPVKKCAPWESVVLADDAVVWSEVPDKEAVEFAVFYARVGDGDVQTLGEGTTGSLVWCGEAAWYINQSDQRLLRWTPTDGLQTAYQVPASTATDVNVIGAPKCTNGSVSFPASLHNDGTTSDEVIIRANLN